MNQDNKISPLGPEEEARLWEYIDGLSSTEEKTFIERLIQNDAEWRAKYEELLQAHQLMQSSELDEPSMRFTRNVMDEIARLHIAPATSTYINKNIIRGIAIFFITMIVGFIIYGIGQLQLDWSTGADKALPFDITKVNFGKLFNNTYSNAFIIVNVILGLFLIDRYLADKRRKHREANG